MIKINKTKAKEATERSFPVLGLAFLILLVAKLGGFTTLSWWWVTAPLWGPFAIFFGIVGIILVVMGILAIFIALAEAYENRKWRKNKILKARFSLRNK